MLKFILFSDYTSNCKWEKTKMGSSICSVLIISFTKNDWSNHLIIEYAIY
jgi:hypothetical protein